jgi:phosphoribosyl-ATP pyrophosphohydrolase
MANAARPLNATPEVLNRLWSDIDDQRDADPAFNESARLLENGTAKIAQRFGEESLECLLEAAAGNREAVVGKSADVLHHLLALWVDAGVRPHEIWQELENRERAASRTGGPNGSVKRLLKSVQLIPAKGP